MQSIIYPTAYGSNENMLVCGNNSTFYIVHRRLLTPLLQLPPVLYVSHCPESRHWRLFLTLLLRVKQMLPC
jgi:hypothetical protein